MEFVSYRRWNDTTSFRQLSIGKPSFRQPSIGQLFNKVSIHQPCRLVNLLISQPVDSSTELKNTSIRQLTKKNTQCYKLLLFSSLEVWSYKVFQ